MLESVLYPRGHDCTVVKGRSRLDVRKCSLSQRARLHGGERAE